MIDSVIVHNSVYSLGQIFSRPNYRESVVGRIGTKGRTKLTWDFPGQERHYLIGQRVRLEIILHPPGPIFPPV